MRCLDVLNGIAVSLSFEYRLKIDHSLYDKTYKSE